MAFKDALLQVSSYPEPTSAAAIKQAIDLAAVLDTHLSALTFKMDFPLPGNVLANALLDIPGMVAEEQQKSVTNAHELMSLFERLATERGVPHTQIIEPSTTSQLPVAVTEHARTYDVAMIPVGEVPGLQQYVAESVIFGSGRPVIVLPETPKRHVPLSLDVVGVAWDFSRPAARAVADALPILKQARVVRVVTIRDEKKIDTRRTVADLARHLERHGIEIVVDEEAARGRKIGLAIEQYAAANDLGLLVMGAYGHSRLRDFVLGGATKSIVANPPLPVFLAH
jgi:nucleotide-binding universal stress UspA family protein